MPGPSATADDPGAVTELRDEVLEVVRQLLAEAIGPEYLVGITIGLDSSFDEDLEMESIEFVALNERLAEHYGDRIDLIAWLATKELDEIIAMRVGDLVDFVVSELAPSPPAHTPPTPSAT